MSKKVLIRKQADGIVNYRDISHGRPSAGALARRLFADPTAGKWQKINAGLNLAGKGAAAVLAANDAAQRLHGGNITAPLTIGQTYASLDPSSMSGQTAQEQQQMEIEKRKNAQRAKKINALTDLRINVGDTITNPQGVQNQLQTHALSVQQPPAGLPAETPVPASGLPAGATPPGMGGTNFPHPYQAQWEATGATGRAPPTFTGARGPTGPPPVATPAATQPTQPTQPAAPLDSDLVRATTGTSVPTATTAAPAAPPQATTENPGGYGVDGVTHQQQGTLSFPTYAPNTGPNPPPLPTNPAPGYTPPVPIEPYQQPQQDPGVDHQNLTIDGIRFGSQTAFDMALKRRMNRSFATYVLDQFGDMLHKADPHVAGLLAFRVYMDKVLKE